MLPDPLNLSSISAVVFRQMMGCLLVIRFFNRCLAKMCHVLQCMSKLRHNDRNYCLIGFSKIDHLYLILCYYLMQSVKGMSVVGVTDTVQCLQHIVVKKYCSFFTL